MTIQTFNVFGTLNTCKTAMNAQQAGLSVTGQNVANVNTPGYHRRSVILASVQGPPTGGGGVAVQGIKRYTDEFASKRLNEETTLQGSAQQRSNVLSHVADLFNDLGDTAIGSTLDNLFGGFRLLESNPGDLTVRQEVIARATELANTFNRVSSEITGIRSSMDALLRSSAAEVNVRAEELVAINKQIVTAKIGDGDISDLLDKQDRLVLEISEHVQVSAVKNSEDQLTLFLEGGLPLVEGINLSRLQVDETAAPGTARIEYVASNGQVADITNRVVHGAMGGTLEVRDQDLPSFLSDLDQLAYDIVEEINTQHAAGFGLDGVGGRNLFTPLGAVAGSAASLSVDAAIVNDPAAIAAAQDPLLVPGDNRNSLELAALADQLLANGNSQTFNEAYATLVGEVGVATRRATDEIAIRETTISNIEDIRDTATGVSLDEEMTSLIRFQRAYQASARVLGVVDEIIKQILALGAG